MCRDVKKVGNHWSSCCFSVVRACANNIASGATVCLAVILVAAFHLCAHSIVSCVTVCLAVSLAAAFLLCAHVQIISFPVQRSV